MCVLRVLALVLSILFAGAASASAQSVTYQATPAHDGHVDDPSLVPPLALRWDRRLSGEVSYPLVVDGRVFVTTSTPGGAYGSVLHAPGEFAHDSPSSGQPPAASGGSGGTRRD